MTGGAAALALWNPASLTGSSRAAGGGGANVGAQVKMPREIYLECRRDALVGLKNGLAAVPRDPWVDEKAAIGAALGGLNIDKGPPRCIWTKTSSRFSSRRRAS